MTISRSNAIHMRRVAELGCAVCRRIGHPGTPAQLHHPRAGMGLSQRAGDDRVIPLCYEHHLGKTGVHNLGRQFPDYWGFSEADLLNDTLELL